MISHAIAAAVGVIVGVAGLTALNPVVPEVKILAQEPVRIWTTSGGGTPCAAMPLQSTSGTTWATCPGMITTIYIFAPEGRK